jgi:hypothetical protein
MPIKSPRRRATSPDQPRSAAPSAPPDRGGVSDALIAAVLTKLSHELADAETPPDTKSA